MKLDRVSKMAVFLVALATLTPTMKAEPIIAVSGNLNFGNLQLGTSAQRTMVISNAGTSTLTVSTIDYPAGFSSNFTPGTIAPGGFVAVTVTFTAINPVPLRDVVIVGSDATSGNNIIGTSADVYDYIPVKGLFEGIFVATNTVVAVDNIGFFWAESNPDGTFTAIVQLAGKKHLFSGRFSSTGSFTQVIHRKGLGDVTVSLQAGFGGGYIWEGAVSSGPWSAPLTAVQDPNHPGYPASLAGNYHMTIVGSGPPPITNGITNIRVTKSGIAKITGTLGDGTPISTVGVVSINGQIPFFSFLYSNQGYIYGWISLDNLGVHGTVDWFKPAGIDPKFPGGFSVETTVNGYDY